MMEFIRKCFINFESSIFHILFLIFPSAITGIESGGLVYRLDLVPIELKQFLNPPANIISDEEILSQLIEGLKGG